jgi:hypothetical protein
MLVSDFKCAYVAAVGFLNFFSRSKKLEILIIGRILQKCKCAKGLKTPCIQSNLPVNLPSVSQVFSQ